MYRAGKIAIIISPCSLDEDEDEDEREGKKMKEVGFDRDFDSWREYFCSTAEIYTFIFRNY